MNREEVLPWVTHGYALVFASCVEQVDLAMVVTNDESSIV